MIWGHIKHFLLPITIVILLSFGQVISDLSLPDFLSKIVDNGIVNGDTAYILKIGGVMLLISLLGISCAIIAGFLASKVALGVGKNIRNSLFSKVTEFSFSETDKIGTASLITRTTNDVQQIQTTTFMMLRIMLRAPLMCIGGIIMAVRKDGDLSLLLFSILPIIALIFWVIIRKSMPLFRRLQVKIDRLNLILRENLIGIRIVRAFSRIGYEKKRFSKANEELTDTSLRINRLMAILNPTMMLGMNVLTILIVWTASFRIDKGDLMIGDMLAFVQYAMMIFMSFTMLSMLFVLLPRTVASAERITEVLKTETAINDSENAITILSETGMLKFVNVSFKYPGAEEPAVCNISFTASAGETIAIIGGTGSGKTTLINLIMRFYDVCKGEIRIGGVNISEIKQNILRDKIGFVPQQTFLFSGSIKKNIRFGKESATLDEIKHACSIAQASEFIEQLPDKYETHISQGGTNFSGGQKQRLSIARAIVKRPDIYIFDDSFSALDFKTDAALRLALKPEIKNSIVIIVAQRVTSIKDANKILVMDNGRIVGIGNHKELLESSEVYREIVSSQLSNQEIGL